MQIVGFPMGRLICFLDAKCWIFTKACASNWVCVFINKNVCVCTSLRISLVWLWINIPVNNISVMSYQSHNFLDVDPYSMNLRGLLKDTTQRR